MSVLCFAAGALCLAYFVLLLLYSGFTSAFYLVWPMMAGGFFILGKLVRIQFWRHLPHALRIGLIVIVSAGLLFFVGVESMILRASVQESVLNLDYIIVLGAHVRPTGPSRALALRLDKAAEYALSSPNTIVIVSGGQGANEPCTEALAMHDYLTAKGLPKERIVMEERSTNTRENLIFSKELIPQGASVGIVSNGFHICRALHLAETLGYENAAGIPAKSDLPTQPANLLREFFAVVKDFWILR